MFARWTVQITRAAAAIGLLVAGCSQAEGPAAAKDDNFVTSNGPELALRTATSEAVASLPVFWKVFERQPLDATDFLVKVSLPVGDGRVEHIWADVVRRAGDQVVVRLANDPVWLKDVQNGSELTVPAAQISDWSYSKQGKAFGHFTTRALMSRAAPAERAEAQAFLAPTSLEPDAP
jgi:uncharacterized protein YegJ (DUF2314 family)